jgi:hypothetical protein
MALPQKPRRPLPKLKQRQPRRPGRPKSKAAPAKAGSKRKKRDDDDDEEEAEEDEEYDEDIKPPPSKRGRKAVAPKTAKGKGKVEEGEDDAQEDEDGEEEGGDDALAGKSVPGLLLANKWDLETGLDPTGWWISEKLDGVRYVLLFSVYLPLNSAYPNSTYYDGNQFISRLGNPYMPPDWFLDSMPFLPSCRFYEYQLSPFLSRAAERCHPRRRALRRSWKFPVNSIHRQDRQFHSLEEHHLPGMSNITLLTIVPLNSSVDLRYPFAWGRNLRAALRFPPKNLRRGRYTCNRSDLCRPT